eukprot:TRINITY_DN3331_c1_g6_i1.p1 TRINITY_DN3331_c1_g6~~TRINITY_DN3331_c1_g6_i1.p1  ORF type:complete len:170 (-),score=28.95 TRINITY_DN3331_c1_g6_i1:124-633(-)
MDVNPEEEQTMELEVLSSIYGDDFETIEDKKFRINLKPNDMPEDEVSLALIYTYTATYPLEPPLLEIEPKAGISYKNLDILKSQIEAEALANVGMSMIFTLTQIAKDWVEDYSIDRTKRILEEEIQRDNQFNKKIVLGDVENRAAKLVGTPVTPESFALWKQKLKQKTL